jgi:hypothetical protein
MRHLVLSSLLPLILRRWYPSVNFPRRGLLDIDWLSGTGAVELCLWARRWYNNSCYAHWSGGIGIRSGLKLAH